MEVSVLMGIIGLLAGICGTTLTLYPKMMKQHLEVSTQLSSHCSQIDTLHGELKEIREDQRAQTKLMAEVVNQSSLLIQKVLAQ